MGDQNTSRSQMATAFAERERHQRNLKEPVTIITGGTDPRDQVHDDVIRVLEEVRIDIRDRTPREITADDVVDAEYIVTMGCSVADFAPDGWDGTAETWNLEHPAGDDLDSVRAQRDEIRRRIQDLFDRIEFASE